MAKMGKVSAEDVKKDKQQRGSKRSGSFARYKKFPTGTTFARMMPPSENMTLPWCLSRKHFRLGPNQKGVTACTETGKDCFACKSIRKDLNSPKASVRKLAEQRRQAIANNFLMIDVTPLYTKSESKKGRFVADNPPPECWGSIKKDEDGDPIGKCQRCSWNASCNEGLTIAGLSGQRIDDLADYFDDDTDLTDLVKGRNIKISKKGEKMGDISYSVDASEKYAWEIPIGMRKVIKGKFFDITEVIKPATAEQTEDAWKGRAKNDDLPECFGQFNPKKSKCKKCEMADICAEEEGTDKDEDDDEDDKKPKKSSKKEKPQKKKVEVDEDDDDEDEEDEDLEDEDDDDDVEDSDEDEDEEEKPKKKAKKATKDSDDDDEDEDEEDEEDVDEEDEDEEDEDEGDNFLDSLSRTELKQFIENNELPIKVMKSMEDEDIVKAIEKNLNKLTSKKKGEIIKKKLTEKASKKK